MTGNAQRTVLGYFCMNNGERYHAVVLVAGLPRRCCERVVVPAPPDYLLFAGFVLGATIGGFISLVAGGTQMLGVASVVCA